jgi:hypothetical protein
VKKAIAVIVPEAKRVAQSIMTSPFVDRIKKLPKWVLVGGIAVIGVLFLSLMFAFAGDSPTRVWRMFIGASKTYVHDRKRTEVMKEFVAYNSWLYSDEEWKNWQHAANS